MSLLQDIINQERRGAVTKDITASNVKNASAITNPTAITSMNAGITSPMPSFASGKDGSVGMGEAFQRTAGYDPVGAWMGQFKPVITPTPVVLPTGSTGSPGSTSSTGSTGSTGSTSGASLSASDALALAKYNYEKQQDALKLGGMQKYYDSGSVNTGFDALLKMIGDQGAISEAGVKKAYDTAITNVDQGYDAAKGLGDSGYSALNKYLSANQNDPYSGMRATVGSAPDALTQYLSAYGVSDKPVQGQIQADQLQAQQGAGNYQNVIDLLSRVAQMGASSRGAESAMGQNLFNTTIGQERAGYKTKAEMAQADAMRQIQQIMYEQRMAQESARNSQLQQLAAALAAAGGNAGGGGGPAPAPAAAATVAPVVAPVAPAKDYASNAAYASKAAAYLRPAQTNEEIAALRAQQEEARQNEIRQQMAQARGGY